MGSGGMLLVVAVLVINVEELIEGMVAVIEVGVLVIVIVGGVVLIVVVVGIVVVPSTRAAMKTSPKSSMEWT